MDVIEYIINKILINMWCKSDKCLNKIYENIKIDII